ncbi:MAG: GIY-YIG nuclease family protein [archaeon]|nr:MAG: GIY-YIG nuclease family protein [archaeon]
MRKHYLYILTCSDGSLYTGYTTDPRRRLSEHRRGVGSKYTRGRLPVELSYLERAGSRSAALKREFALKRLSRREKLALVKSFAKQKGDSPR